MAKAQVRTLLPLDTWARNCGLNPLHFNGVYFNGESEGPGCGSITPQYAWQNADMVGREDIALAIKAAEDAIAHIAGYPVAPDWIVDEYRQYERFYDRAFWSGYGNARGAMTSLTTRYGYVISGGVKARSLIDADAAITYSDADGDGYDETATVTVTTSVTDPNEIAVFFPGEDGADEWEVRPLRKVTIDSGTATIVFRREQVPLPAFWEGLAPNAPNGIDGGDDANFLEEVDVYRVYNDPQTQASLLWEPWDQCGCSGSGCEACAFDSQSACLHTRDNRLGIVVPSPATWNADDAVFNYAGAAVCRTPDKARLWYRAGWKGNTARPMVDMDPSYAWMVSVLACTYLDRPVCGCDTVAQYIGRWREDLSGENSRENEAVSYKIDPAMLNNPLGPMRGAVEVWRRLNQAGRIVVRPGG
jgi:hypothetical protein